MNDDHNWRILDNLLHAVAMAPLYGHTLRVALPIVCVSVSALAAGLQTEALPPTRHVLKTASFPRPSEYGIDSDLTSKV